MTAESVGQNPEASEDLQDRIEKLEKQVQQLKGDNKALKVVAERFQDEGQQEGEERRQKYELYVTLTGIVCASMLVALTMGLFGLPQKTGNPIIFQDASHVLHGLALAFGIIGTLTGAYFGIKSSNEARTQAEKARKDAHELASSLVEQMPPATKD